MRSPNPLAWSIDLALDLDLAADPVGGRAASGHLRLLPPLPSTGTVRGPDNHG
jgi:hypothetical protein